MEDIVQSDACAAAEDEADDENRGADGDGSVADETVAVQALRRLLALAAQVGAIAPHQLTVAADIDQIHRVYKIAAPGPARVAPTNPVAAASNGMLDRAR